MRISFVSLLCLLPLMACQHLTSVPSQPTSEHKPSYHASHDSCRVPNRQQWEVLISAGLPERLNALGLVGVRGEVLWLDAHGEGTWQDEIIYHLDRAINAAYRQGANLSGYAFLAQRKSSMPYYIADFGAYLDHLDSVSGRQTLPLCPTTSHIQDALSTQLSRLAGESLADNRILVDAQSDILTVTSAVLSATEQMNMGKQVELVLLWQEDETF